MISVIALVVGGGGPPDRVRELVVRSLSWLVPAVVSGAVRDVVAACPEAWPVADIMDHAGCAFARADAEAERTAAALVLAKCQRLLVVRMGYRPQGPLVEEIASRDWDTLDWPAQLLMVPAGLFERLFPDRAPRAGVLVDRSTLGGEANTFADLVRSTRGSPCLRVRMAPVF